MASTTTALRSTHASIQRAVAPSANAGARPARASRYQPRSIAFNKLGHVAFCELLDKMLTAASQVFGDALTEAARKEFHKMVGG
jgi:hypothetical protein